MERTDLIFHELDASPQKAGITAPSAVKRKHNIDWVMELDRTGLVFGEREKRLLVYETRDGERLFIQYPGKESARSRKDIKPFDFRPKIFLKDRQMPEVDKDFKQIWDRLFEQSDILIRTGRSEYISMMAAVLYRMAFMCDHAKDDQKTSFHCDIIDSTSNVVISSSTEHPGSIYTYVPPKESIALVSEALPKWDGISFEAFLVYNDLLAWNEDVKYYHRNQEQKDGKWLERTGRINNILTHVRILGFLLKKVPLSKIFDGFSKSRGVSPAIDKEVLEICGDYIHE